MLEWSTHPPSPPSALVMWMWFTCFESIDHQIIGINLKQMQKHTLFSLSQIYDLRLSVQNKYRKSTYVSPCAHRLGTIWFAVRLPEHTHGGHNHRHASYETMRCLPDRSTFAHHQDPYDDRWTDRTNKYRRRSSTLFLAHHIVVDDRAQCYNHNSPGVVFKMRWSIIIAISRSRGLSCRYSSKYIKYCGWKTHVIDVCCSKYAHVP